MSTIDGARDSYLNPPASSTTEPSASGVTTPDLVAEEKERRQSSEQSINEKDRAVVTDADDTPAEVYPTGRGLVPILIALIFSVFLVAIDMTILGTAIPKITDDFNGLNSVTWYGSVYFMTFGGFQPAAGKFYRYFPLKTSFLGAIAVFLIGSLICAVAPGSTVFIVGRAVAGVGAAFVSTGAFTIVAFAAEPKIRPGLIGLIGAAWGLSACLGPILGGVFSDEVTWRWCFYINLPVGGLAGVLIFFFFKTPPHAVTTKATWKEKVLQMDPLGTALVMGGIISFILATEYGGQKKPWSSGTVIGLLVGCTLIWTTFIVWEFFNGERAMLPRRIFSLRYVWQPSAFQFFFAAGYVVLLYYLPLYFQSVDNRSAIGSGVLNLPLVLAMVVGSIVSGTLVTKTGHAAPFMMVGAVFCTISAGLMYTFDIDTSMGKWIGYQFLYGLAIGMAFQMGITIAQANASSEDMSSVTAIVFFFQTIGGAFAISSAQSGFANRLVAELGRIAPQINTQMVIGTGATQLRNVFSGEELTSVVLAYMAGIKVALALVVGLTGFTCVIVAFVPRQKLNAEALKNTGAAA